MALITRDEVVGVLQRIASEHPDNVNPADGAGSCVYTDTDGCHCLVGQVLVELGIPVPPARSRYRSARFLNIPAANRFEDSAKSLLNRAQMEADAGGFFGSREWGEVVKYLRSRGLLP